MRIHVVTLRRIVVVAGAVVTVGLAAWGLQLGVAPAALAQSTCPAGQRYCPSGTYSGQCRTNTVTCPTGSVAATVEGCSSCSCPSGQVVCSGACQVARQCPDANRATANQCAATNAASCGSCAGGYALNNTSGLCEEVITVVVTPTTPQLGNSERSAVNVIQGGAGLLLNLQAQSGDDATTRKNVLTVDKTGVQVGWHPDTTKLGLDLSTAGGQNLIYGIARAVGMDPALDALLLLQTIGQDGSITDRIKITRDGNLTASGNVRGSQLCIGGDCKSSWDAVAPSSVLLQDATPGTAQTGHFNLSGTGRVGSLVVNGGITAGGSVGIVGANGKIPAINSTYFTSLTGTSLVALNASNLAIGTVPDARLPSGLLQNPIDGGSGNVGPWLTIQGGGAVLSNTSLRLYDAGTAAANANILEFAHNGGSGPVAIARVKSANVDANAANGGVLALETASNNAGVWNAGQLTLYNNGRVGVGLTPGGPTPSERLHVGGKVYANDGVTIGASGTVNLQGGDIINADVIIGGADTATQPFLQFVSGYLKLKPSNVAWGLVVGNSDPAIPGGFAHFWHDGTSVVFNDGTSNPAQGMKLNGNDLTVSNTITAGNDLAVVDNVTVGGDVTVTGDIDAKNSFECVNVGTELRCNLREFWRTADRTSGYVESWRDSRTCTSVCTAAGLKACSDIQFNYECPNGTLLNSGWSDDDPGEFGGGSRTCASSEPYRATISGVSCPGQTGTEYKRYRCRCQS